MHNPAVLNAARAANADNQSIVYTTSMAANAYGFANFLDLGNLAVIVWYIIAGIDKKH